MRSPCNSGLEGRRLVTRAAPPRALRPPPRRLALDVEVSVPDFSQMSDADLEAYVVQLGGPAALSLSAPAVTPPTSLPAPQHLVSCRTGSTP
jgi:hypothetical protein